MNLLEKLSKKGLASGKLGWQIIGALLEWRPRAFWVFILLVTPLSIGFSYILAPEKWILWLCFLGLNLMLWLAVKVCQTLSNLFSLRKKEAGITWCQISILGAFGIWILGFILIFSIQKDGRLATVFGIIGTAIGWIFQDKLKGVVAFIHLRMHNLLNIGDWIQVPKYNADGEVKGITLTTVTIYNWDTTTSTIPILALQTDHFINLQRMAGGKTYGRRILKDFLLDTSCFHPITAAEAERLRSDAFNSVHDVRSYLPAEEIKEGALNSHLYRLYIYHWLMNHPHVSQKPRLYVRWMDQKEDGMPLQVYTFLLDSGGPSFFWEQSRIIEEIIESLEWFGLRLYQAPSASDVRSLNKHLKDEA